MAATDQHYRKQRVLDIVFAVSSILMLLSLFWMFWQDYNREFKHVQRKFRDVEDEVFLRTMVRSLPDEQRINAIDEAEDKLAKAKDKLAKERVGPDRDIRNAKGKKEIADAKTRSIKADYDSRMSYYDMEVEELGRAQGELAKAKSAADKGHWKDEVNELTYTVARLVSEGSRASPSLSTVWPRCGPARRIGRICISMRG